MPSTSNVEVTQFMRNLFGFIQGILRLVSSRAEHPACSAAEMNHIARFLVVALFIVSSPLGALSQVDLRSQGVPKQLTMRFEGATAPTNYAEVVAALGREDLLPLRVHVDEE